MHRAAIVTISVVGLALAPFLYGGVDAPGDVLVASSVRTQPVIEAASAPDPCAPLPEARVATSAGRAYVALAWAPCEGVEGYQVLRGESRATLAPLVQVRHPGHIDVAVAPDAAVLYAVVALGSGLPADLHVVPVKIA